MSPALYYLLCLGAGLLAIACASALIVRHLRWRAERQVKAIAALDALTRYTGWVASQGRAIYFEEPAPVTDPSLQEIGALQELWFPEMHRASEDLFAVHIRLVGFLQAQHSQRLDDPEAWFETGDADAAFMTLWREHRLAAQALERRLAAIARSVPSEIISMA